MKQHVIETSYSITFREHDAKVLGGHLKNRHSVVLVGMKRVGISNFLRFFLNHKDIKTIYISSANHIFIPVDLNDLFERELFPFWSLTLKRIVDAVVITSLPEETKKEIESLFSASIQSQDIFLTIDSVRKALVKIVEADALPTIFFLRFDRIKDAVTPAFFDNLHGLADSTNRKLSYVFTSYRTLDKLSPSVFTKALLSLFARTMYMKPAEHKDIRVIYNAYKKHNPLALSDFIEDMLFQIVDGYVQYLQLALITLHEQKQKPQTEEDVYNLLSKDERMILQSEELWESLEVREKDILQKVVDGRKITEVEQQTTGRYLWDTGIVQEQNGTSKVFSALFTEYISKLSKKEKTGTEFSKKEHQLFCYLKEHVDAICEREKIIEEVWPEVTTLGVTDWAVDRLVARVRNKLKQQNSQYKVETIKTRGYKLVSS